MNILVFGDSITYGAWDMRGGWVQRLREYLDKRTLKDIDKYTIIYNLGVDGDTSRDILRRLEKETTARISNDSETVFIFSFGSNDCAFVHSEKEFLVSEEEFVKNTEEIIYIAKNFSKNIIFLGLLNVDQKKVDPVPWAKHISYINEHTEKFDDMLKRICHDKGVYFVDMPSLPNAYLEDGVHPNSKGHEKIFETVKKYLEKNKLI
jgi:lysophospholipase L1-like esterase